MEKKTKENVKELLFWVLIIGMLALWFGSKFIGPYDVLGPQNLCANTTGWGHCTQLQTSIALHG